MKYDRSIQEVMTEAGKYEDVINSLEKLAADKDINYPVMPFMKDGKFCNNLDANSVRTEATILIQIVKDKSSTLKTVYEAGLDDLRTYAHDRVWMVKYNIGNTLSHRQQVEDKVLTAVRTWSIISNLFEQADLWEEDDKDGYYIPIGWYKHEGEV